jgi:hypothetical protein
MNQIIIDYLRNNKEKYSKELLIEQLLKAGHSELDIKESSEFVYDGKEIAEEKSQINETGSFWNFKLKKTYVKPSEKWKDFLFGFFAPFAINFILTSLRSFLFRSIFNSNFNFIFSSIISGGIFLTEILLIIYLFKRRKFISYGLITNFSSGLLFVGLVMLISMAL